MWVLMVQERRVQKVPAARVFSQGASGWREEEQGGLPPTEHSGESHSPQGGR